MTKKFFKLGLMSAATVVMLTACGGGGGDNAVDDNNAIEKVGYLSDARIQGVQYTCGSETTGVTDVNGTFKYTSNCSTVHFQIGEVVLGSIVTSKINADGIVYPSDLLGLDRNNTSNLQLTNMLQFIQSLDEDGYPGNGININKNVSLGLNAVTLRFDNNSASPESINEVLLNLGLNLVDRDFAIAHYENTLRNEQHLSINTITQERLDELEAAAIRSAISSLTSFRDYTYTQQWNTGEAYSIVFSEPRRAATTGNQSYEVAATIMKGGATEEVTLTEVVPFHQSLRDAAEVAAIKTALSALTSFRSYTYSQQWSTGEAFSIAFSENIRAATTENQSYGVTATIIKGGVTQNVTLTEEVPFSQSLRDVAEVAAIKTALSALTSFRSYTYTQQWTTGDAYSIAFSENVRAATTGNQSYGVTVTITKGGVTQNVTLTETVPFSQTLRNESEVNTILNGLSNISPDSLRNYSYTQQWSTQTPYTISFNTPPRIATAIDQQYPVTITVSQGSYSHTITLIELVPTTNVNITLGDGTIALINDEYANTFRVDNGGLFQKINFENQFIGSAISIDTSTLGTNVSSSVELLNYIIANSNLSGLNLISNSQGTDGSMVARYEISLQQENLYQLLVTLLGSINYNISNIDIALYSTVTNAVVDFYIEYDPAHNTSYVIIALTDKQLNVDSDITKIINKDSIVKQNEVIINNQETFTYSATQAKGDFIFVIDDSGSMSTEQASTIEAVQREFSSAINRYNMNWKATVIGTEDSYDYSTLVGNPSENNISQLAADLDYLTTGGSDEVGIKRIYGYMTDGSIVERNNSSTTIIYASDEYCHTQLSEIGLNEDNLANSYFVQNGIKFNAILPENHQNNNDLAYRMALATGGDVANMYNYTSGYGQMMNLAVRYAMAKSSSIKLVYPALASSISVHVNGARVTSWEYDPSEKAIVFSQGYSPSNGDEVVVTYSHLDYASMVESAKNEFDALADDEKRAYTNDNIDITFDPVQRTVSATDTDSYTVTVTFSKYGFELETTFIEAPLESNYILQNSTDWAQDGNTFTSQNHANSSSSSMTIEILSNTTIDYAVSSESCCDKLYISINGASAASYTGQDALDVSAGDIIELQYRKDSSISSGNDETIVTIN